VVSSLIGGLCPKIKKMALLRAESFFLGIGHIGYLKKSRIFMLISKILICLSDKMLPKKLKLKKCF
jgi:hypothetical protein